MRPPILTSPILLRIYTSDISPDGTVSSDAISRECSLHGIETTSVSPTLISELRKYSMGSEFPSPCVSVCVGSETQLYVQFMCFDEGNPKRTSPLGWLQSDADKKAVGEDMV